MAVQPYSRTPPRACRSFLSHQRPPPCFLTRPLRSPPLIHLRPPPPIHLRPSALLLRLNLTANVLAKQEGIYGPTHGRGLYDWLSSKNKRYPATVAAGLVVSAWYERNTSGDPKSKASRSSGDPKSEASSGDPKSEAFIHEMGPRDLARAVKRQAAHEARGEASQDKQQQGWH